MKVRHFLTALAIAATGSAFAADNHNHGHEHKPLHGGVVVEVKDMDFELVAKPEVLQLYVRDHGKPVDISKATAKITVLTGAEKQESDLRPQGGRLEATGNFKVTAGSKVVAQFNANGKSISARFVLK